MFLYLKALHIIFVVTWFAGLFYIVRLFIYHAEANQKSEPERSILINQFKIMEKRLWYGITWPSAILAMFFGLSIFHNFFPLIENPWLIAKLFLVVCLFMYHLVCGKMFKRLQKDDVPYTSMQLRYWNEIATLFLVGIVFLAVLKSILSLLYGIVGLLVFTFILVLGIRLYRRRREGRKV